MPKQRNDSGKDWSHTDNQGGKLDGGAYEQQEWGKNCVMFALSKVLGESTGALAKRIVDGRIGGVTMIKQMENSSVIKKVLAELGFTPVIEGGAKWGALRTLIKAKAPRRFYATYWRNKTAEDWSDREVAPGRSDHAFTILAYDEAILLPGTNDSTFDRGHPTADDFISAWLPPEGSGVEKDRSFTVLPPGARKVAY